MGVYKFSDEYRIKMIIFLMIFELIKWLDEGWGIILMYFNDEFNDWIIG
jgi:hypothetical protein